MKVAAESSGKDGRCDHAKQDYRSGWADSWIHGRGYTASHPEGIGGTMTISQTAVCGLLLGLFLLWLPSSAGAQGTMLSVMGCRADADELFNKAADLSIDDKVFYEELAKFEKKCKTKEAGSMQSIPRRREQLLAARQERDESLKRLMEAADKFEKTWGPGGYQPHGHFLD